MMIIRSCGGLCSRLRTLFSYQKSAPDGKITAVWDTNTKCNGQFLDCFEPVPGMRFTTDAEICEELGLSVENMRKLCTYDGYNEHPDHKGQDEYLYDALRPTDRIRSRVDSIVAEKPIAVHVRRTDFDQLARTRGCYVPDETFFQWIDAHDSGLIYLATDNRQTQDAFASRYGGRLIVRRWITPSDAIRQTPIEDCVIDLLACVGARSFMGTRTSSFTATIEQMRAA